MELYRHGIKGQKWGLDDISSQMDRIPILVNCTRDIMLKES